jgi:flagellin
MVISTNSTAQQSADLLATSSANLAKSLQRLSSGKKIVSPEDDAAGLAVSMKFDAQSKRIGAAVANISNAISYTKTQDGYLGQVSKALNRMSELALSAQDVTKTSTDLSLYDKEFQTLASYITDTASKDFNGVSLFDDKTKDVTVDDGATNNFQLIATDLGNPAYTSATRSNFQMSAIDLGNAAYTAATASTVNLTSASTAGTALGLVKSAIVQLANDRAQEGASLTRLNYSKDQLIVQRTNIDSANSVISDVDVATESTNFAKQNILVQSGTAMLAQANVQGQSVLRLLG